MLLTGSWQGQKSCGAAARAAHKPPSRSLPHCFLGAPSPTSELGEQNALYICASESLKFKDVTLRSPGPLSGLRVLFKRKHAHAFPSAISACSDLGQRKRWWSNPSFTAVVQGFFSAPRQAHKLHSSPRSRFPSSPPEQPFP